MSIDRAAVIADAQPRYRLLRRPLVVEDPARPVATLVTGTGVRRRIKLAELEDWASQRAQRSRGRTAPIAKAVILS